MGLVPLKKLECLEEPGEGGIWDNVSIVRSDSEGRARPRVSASSTDISVPCLKDPIITLSVSNFPPSLILV